MANGEAKMRILTLEQANSLLPRVRSRLKSIREQRNAILRTQAQIEIEEMTGTDSQGVLTSTAQAALTRLMGVFQDQTGRLEAELREMSGWGAHLKDLDSGLVDFYCRRGPDIVFLCWKEGEPEIQYWHPLQGGFQTRQPL